MVSSFTLGSPLTVFQVWFVVYVYLLPVMLYAAWAGLALMDIGESRAPAGLPWVLAIILLPLVGGAAYLLLRAHTLGRPLRLAAVLCGTLAWLVPLAAALWIAGGPLGPKALS